MYRAFSADFVQQIVEDDIDPHNLIGLRNTQTKVEWHPQVLPHNNNTHEGMYVLTKLPHGQLRPVAFVPGSRAGLEEVLVSVQKHFKYKRADYVVAWEDFCANAPLSDDVDEYCISKPLYVPFNDVLFTACNADNGQPRIFQERIIEKDPDGIKSKSLDSAHWNNRGEPLGFIPPLLFIDDNANTDGIQGNLNLFN